MEQEYTIDNSYLSPEAQKRKKDLEENPASRTNHMEYMDGMEVLDSDIKDKVRAAMQSYDYNAYTDADVRTALANAKQGHCGIEDFKALFIPCRTSTFGGNGCSGTEGAVGTFRRLCVHFHAIIHCELL